MHVMNLYVEFWPPADAFEPLDFGADEPPQATIAAAAAIAAATTTGS
jgi:hypothetical protein